MYKLVLLQCAHVPNEVRTSLVPPVQYSATKRQRNSSPVEVAAMETAWRGISHLSGFPFGGQYCIRRSIWITRQIERNDQLITLCLSVASSFAMRQTNLCECLIETKARWPVSDADDPNRLTNTYVCIRIGFA